MIFKYSQQNSSSARSHNSPRLGIQGKLQQQPGQPSLKLILKTAASGQQRSIADLLRTEYSGKVKQQSSASGKQQVICRCIFFRRRLMKIYISYNVPE